MWESIFNFSKKDCCPYHLLHFTFPPMPKGCRFLHIPVNTYWRQNSLELKPQLHPGTPWHDILIYIYIYSMGSQRVRHDWAIKLNYEVSSVCVCLSSQLYWRIRILFFTLFNPQYSVQDVYTAGPKVLCRCSNICWVNKKMNHLNLTEKELGEIGWM